MEENVPAQTQPTQGSVQQCLQPPQRLPAAQTAFTSSQRQRNERKFQSRNSQSKHRNIHRTQPKSAETSVSEKQAIVSTPHSTKCRLLVCKKFTRKLVQARREFTFTSGFRCVETEELANHLLEWLLNSDREIHRGIVLREEVLPRLLADKTALQKQIDELLQENEKLKEEKQGLVSSLETESKGQREAVVALEKQAMGRDEQLKTVNQQLRETREQLEREHKTINELQEQVKSSESTIKILTEEQKRGKQLHKNNREKVEKLSKSNGVLQKQIQAFKRTARNRERAIGNLETEATLRKAQIENFKEQQVALEKRIDEAEASREQEVQLRKKLETMYPEMIASSFERSTRDIINLIEKRKRGREKTQVGTIGEDAVPAKKRTVNEADGLQNCDMSGVEATTSGTNMNRNEHESSTMAGEMCLLAGDSGDELIGESTQQTLSNENTAGAQWSWLENSTDIENGAGGQENEADKSLTPQMPINQ